MTDQKTSSNFEREDVLYYAGVRDVDAGGLPRKDLGIPVDGDGESTAPVTEFTDCVEDFLMEPG